MVNKLKIIHIIPNLGKGGAERLVIDICNELHKREEVEYRLVVLDDKNDYKYLTEKLNYVVCPVMIGISLFKKNKIDLTSLDNIIQSFQPNIIHSHIFYADFVSRLHLYPNIKYFSHIHGRTTQYERIKFSEVFSKRRWTDLYESFLIVKSYKKCNNNFIVVSNHTFNYLKEILPKKLLKNVCLLHNAISTNLYFQETKKINPEELKLISIGRLDENKNHIFLISVIEHLRKNGVNAFLNILGEGVEKNKLKEKISQLKLDNSILLSGNVDNVSDYLSQSNIYIHAAKIEAMGIVLLEAMATGLPVVTLDGRGNRDIIEDEKNGFMINEPSVEKFAEKIILLINNPELYQKMSAYAIKYAKKYDIKEYVDKLLELYKSKL